MPPVDWLIYALGGGWGHLNRAAALALAARHRCSVRILTNSPYAGEVRAALPDLDLLALDPGLTSADARQQVARAVEAAQPSCLIVDTFPRGLAAELVLLLPSLDAQKVLVHRDLDPEYAAQPVVMDFVERFYDLVLIPGENEGGTFGGDVTEPWILRGASSSRDARGNILICAGGIHAELNWYGEVAALLAERGQDFQCVAAACPEGCPPSRWIRHWPARGLYSDFDIVIGGAGYNTIYECLAAGIPLIARPWPRLYDRQLLRAQRARALGSVTIVQTPAEAANAAIRTPRRRFAPIAANGAAQAVRLIERQIARRASLTIPSLAT